MTQRHHIRGPITLNDKRPNEPRANINAITTETQSPGNNNMRPAFTNLGACPGLYKPTKGTPSYVVCQSEGPMMLVVARLVLPR